MATKDISDRQVCQAYADMWQRRKSGEPGVYADDLLEAATGQPPKVCNSAMERAYRRGLVECGMWLRGGFLTKKGEDLLSLITD